jgi:hypothetical protein
VVPLVRECRHRRIFLQSPQYANKRNLGCLSAGPNGRTSQHRIRMDGLDQLMAGSFFDRPTRGGAAPEIAPPKPLKICINGVNAARRGSTVGVENCSLMSRTSVRPRKIPRITRARQPFEGRPSRRLRKWFAGRRGLRIEDLIDLSDGDAWRLVFPPDVPFGALPHHSTWVPWTPPNEPFRLPIDDFISELSQPSKHGANLKT